VDGSLDSVSGALYMLHPRVLHSLEAPIPCSGHTLASIPQSGSGSSSPTSRFAIMWRVSYFCRLTNDSFLGVCLPRKCRIGTRRSLDSVRGALYLVPS
jgi:hypothetical protein